MNKKTTIGILLALCLCLGMLALTGCEESNNTQTKQLNSVENVQGIKSGTTFIQEQKVTEKNQQVLFKNNPPPMLTNSLERENLIRRYEFLNDRNKIFYVYLMSHGKVVAYYTAKGKISSVNSRLTQEEQAFRLCDRGIRESDGSTRSTIGEGYCELAVVGSPQLDGSYGTNGDGIFFFTTENAYIEWNSEYLISDFPMRITTPPELIMDLTK